MFFPRQSAVPRRAGSVQSGPRLFVTDTAVALTVDEGGGSVGTFVHVFNAGTGSLAGPQVSAVSYQDGSGWLSASYSSDHLVITADPTGLAAAEYVATFDVTDANASAGSPTEVTVTFTVTAVAVEDAVLTCSNRRLAFTCETSGAAPPTQTRTLFSLPGRLDGPTLDALNYLQGSGWVSTYAVSDNGDDTYTLTIAVDQTGLTADDYRAVGVARDTASDAIVEILIDLTVTSPVDPITIDVSPASISVTAEQDSSDPASVVLSIHNPGSAGALAGPTVTEATPVAWLAASALTGSVNDYTSTISFDITGLTAAASPYTVDLTVDDANNSAAAVTVPVTLTITAPSGAQPAYGSAALPRNPAGTAMVWDGDLLQYTGSPVSFDFSAVPTFSGTVHQVSSANALQTALGAAVDGDIIELTADITVTSSPVCANRGTGGWVWIRPSGYASLPTYSGNVYTSTASANRLNTTTHAAALKTITSNGTNVSPLRFAQGASGYWITGIKFTINQTKSINGALVEIISNSTQTTQAHQPSRIVLDRCWVTGPRARRGVNTSGRDMLISGCVIDNIDAADTSDSQAIGNINGGQHLLAFNNELEAVSEPIFSGSGGIGITNQDPSDMAFIRNYVHKRAAWDSNASYGEKKNMFEMKHGVRVLYFGQRHDHYRTAGQFQEIAMTPSSAYSWGTIKDVTIHGVYSTDSNGGWLQMNPQGSSGTEVHLGGARFTMAHCYQSEGGTTTQSRMVLSCGPNAANQRDWPDVTIEHNTLDVSSSFLILDGTLQSRGAQWLRFRCANNVNIRSVEYGPVFASSGVNATALNNCLGAGNWTYVKNGLVTGGSSYGSGGTLLVSPHNCFQDTAANIFTSPGTGDYSILASSSYANSGTDGMDPGADVDWVVNTLTAGVV